jgi:TetR/AcrR family transcriptional repressor of nem operon
MARTREFDETEILDKAVELFWQKGYNATSANDLVKGLGLSRSSIYATFKDKRTLFIKSLNRYRSKHVEAMLAMVRQSEDIMGTLEEIFKMVIEQDIRSQIPKGCLIVNSSIELAPHDQEIANIVNENEKNIESVFETAILKGQEKGQISKKHTAKSLSRFIFNNISGLRVAVKSNQKQDVLNDIVQLCLSVLK